MIKCKSRMSTLFVAEAKISFPNNSIALIYAALFHASRKDFLLSRGQQLIAIELGETNSFSTVFELIAAGLKFYWQNNDPYHQK